MGTKSPLNTLSRGVAQAPERTPEFDAMFSTYRVIPTTLGNLASKVVEEGIVEPSVEAVCEFFGVTPNYLRDDFLITTTDQVESLLARVTARHEEEFDVLFGVKAGAHWDYFLDKAKAWEVEVDDTELAKLELALRQKFREVTQQNLGGKKILMPEIELLKSRMDAIRSGLNVDMLTFIKGVLGYDGESFYTTQAIMGGIQNMIEATRAKHPHLDSLALQEVPVDKEGLNLFLKCLGNNYYWQRRTYAKKQSKAEDLERLIYAPPYWEHPLFAGGEK